MLRRLSILFFVGLLSCMQGTLCATSQVSPFTFHEARQTISMADSMRVNEHRLYDVKQCLGWHCEWCARNVPTLRTKRAT